MLYPHQWLWDSCFVAIGLARYDAQRAADEIRSLFRGQWANGMLPHMVFADGVNDIGSRRIWRSKRNPLAPRDVDTSCVTQPPLASIAVRRVAAALREPDRQEFVAQLFPRLVDYHSWLYRERDLHQSGLVTLLHPWECGLDTTPTWMRQLARMPLPWWLRTSSRLGLARILRRLRYDTRHLPAVERSSDDDGLRMLALVNVAKQHDFDLRKMPPDRSVLIEDLAFNAMLIAANRSLELIARDDGLSLPTQLTTHFRRTETALEDLWDEASGQYYSRDAVSGELLRTSTIATFLPLWAGVIPRARAEELVAELRDPSRFWPRFPVPSVPIDDSEFEPTRYWMGPTWVNMNWAIIEGLRQYGETELAEQLRQRTLGLVEGAEFFEYFSPLDGSGHGAPDFSWTAALTIELQAVG